MKAPTSLRISDEILGIGRSVVPGDVAVCHCECTRSKGDILFASSPEEPYVIRVGARDCYVGIEYGLLGMHVGGQRTIVVPPNLTYHERKTFKDLPIDAMLVYKLTLVELRDKWDPEMEMRLEQSHE